MDGYLVELSKFHMLSLLDDTDHGEAGLVVIFNRELGILYSDHIHGTTKLSDAMPEFYVLEVLEDSEECPNVEEESAIFSEPENANHVSSASDTKKKRGRPKKQIDNVTNTDAAHEDDTAILSQTLQEETVVITEPVLSEVPVTEGEEAKTKKEVAASTD